jgi:hypothetical protein
LFLGPKDRFRRSLNEGIKARKKLEMMNRHTEGCREYLEEQFVHSAQWTRNERRSTTGKVQTAKVKVPVATIKRPHPTTFKIEAAVV